MSFADFKLIGLNRFPTSLYMWGDNTSGLLGDNRAPNYFSWTKISSGGLHTLAIRSDGLLYGWGRNTEGQLMQVSDTVHRSSPTQIGTGSWNQVSAGLSHSIAIRSDNTLWAWGANKYGQLGDNTTVDKSSWVQVGTSSWNVISAGGNHTVGVKVDNTLYAWGFNGSGQLGDTSISSRSSPVIVGTGSGLTNSNAYGLVFNGSTQYLSVANSGTTLDFSTNDFTVEFWVYATSALSAGTSAFSYSNYGDNIGHFGINGYTGKLALSYSNSGTINTYTFGPTWVLNTWYHVAIVRISSVATLYVNGTSYGNSNLGSRDFSNVPGLFIGVSDGSGGTWAAGGNNFPGYISNLRIVKGLGVYTGNFTTPTSPLTTTQSAGTNISAITAGQTILLTCQNTTVIDNSTNAFSITNNASVTYTFATPFTSAIPSGAFFVASISAGKTHTVALTTDNKLYTWGDNTYGELGDSTTINRSSPVQIGSSSWSQVSAGGTHTAGIESDGSLLTWGLNSSGQLGLNNTYSGSYWTQVSEGPTHTLAIRNDGALFVWGRNQLGQLGTGDTTDRSSPVQLGTSSWASVDTGSSHSVAIRSDGKLFTWGSNDLGQLGNFPDPINYTWSKVVITASAAYTFAIRSDGTLWGWGLGTSSNLGDGTALSKSSPTQIGASLNASWIDVAVGSTHTLGITNENTLYTWGIGTSGQLGDLTIVTKNTPSIVGYNYKKVFGGVTISAALDLNNYLYMWGLNSNGALGDGSTSNKSSPMIVGADTWSSLSMDSHVLGIKTTGTLWGWGLNLSGQLGIADAISRSSPVQIGSDSNWTQISAGSTYSLGLKSDGTLWGWGLNTSGQLGLSDTTYRSSPVQIASDTSWLAVAAGSAHTLALSTSGYLYTWGAGTSGGLGDGTIITRSSPVQIGTDVYTKVQAGITFALAVKNDNALFTWGLGTTGQLGDNTLVSRSSPVQIGGYYVNYSSPVQIGASSWTQVSAGDAHTLGLGSDGILYGWGRNFEGQLGGSTNTLGIAWSKVVVGPTHTLGIRFDGKLYAWGDNSSGQLGDRTVVAKTSPILVDTINKWKDITVGQGTQYFSMAIRTDGKLFAWGNNQGGQLGWLSWRQLSVGTGHSLLLRSDGRLYTMGTNTAGQLGDPTFGVTNRSSPVQIGTSSWSVISAGISTSAAIDSVGRLFTWGYNNVGQLGLATTANRSSPVQVTSGSWSQVAIKDYTLAITTQGSIWSWGSNSNGQLGLGTIVDSKVPKLLDGNVTSYSIGFDGIGDYLTLGGQSNFAFGTGNFTVEMWYYPTSLPASGQILYDTNLSGDATGTGRFEILVTTAGVIQLQSGAGVTQTQGGSITLGNWYHIAITRASGSTRIYQNGIQVNTTFTDANNYTNNTNRPIIGANGFNLTVPTFGYISNLRVVKGQALYTSTFTPSTTPLTTTSQGATAANVSLLTAQNATIIDNSSNVFTITSTGTPTTTQYNPFSVISSTSSTSWTSVAAGTHSLAIRTTGSLYAWGLNSTGQLGDSTTISKSSPIQLGSRSWSLVSASMTGHSLAVDTLSVLYVWGNNTYGELGLNNEFVNVSSPTQLSTTLSFTSITAGYNSSIGTTLLNNLTTAYGWGYNNYNQLATINAYSWRSAGTGSGIQANIGSIIGKLYVWGDNTYGQLGNNTTVTKSSTTQVGGFLGASTYKYTVNSVLNTAFINNENLLYIVGDNTYGQLGQGDTISRSSPVQVGTNTWSTIVVSGSGHVLAISATGSLFSWGNNTYNELGQVDSVVANRSSPVTIGSNTDWTSVSVGNNFSMALNNVGAMYTWGRNDIGQLGTANPLSYTSIGAGVASRNDGKLYTWGYNNFGQLGDAALGTNNRSAPTQVSTLAFTSTSWTSVSGSYNNRAGIKIDSKLFVWGDNRYGQLGVSEDSTVNPSRSQPVQILGSWTQLYVNTDNMFAVRSDNTLWSWGNNNIGQLGLGDLISRSSPVQIGSDTNWSMVVASGTGHVIALKTTGALFAWGNNQYNELGQNQRVQIHYSSPIQVGTSSWTKISAGNNNSFAIRTDGALFGWGRNDFGQIGLSGNTPLPVDRLSWTQIATGDSYAVAIRNDGKLFSWGRNDKGQLGLGHTVSKSTPTQIAVSTNYNLYSTFFNGTTDCLSIPANASFAFAGDFTIEGWMYFTNVASATPPQSLIGIKNSTVWFDIRWFTSRWQISLNAGSGTDIGTTPAPINNTWVHVACVRSGSSINLYVNGTSTGTTLTNGSVLGFSTVPLGIGGDAGTGNLLTGYLSNVRIVGGQALYTTNFIPSASVLTTTSQGATAANVALLACQNDRYIDNSTASVKTITPTGTGISTSTLTPFVYTAQPNYSWTQVSTILSHTVAVRNDGTLWAWGANDAGQLSQGDTVTRSAPIQVGSSSWTNVFAGSDTTYAIRTDGGLFTTGNNTYGQLGQGDTISRSNIVQVGTSSWTQISASLTGHVLGILSIGALFAWGYNQYNELGLTDRNPIMRSSPVQVGTSSWTKVSAGNNFSLATRLDFGLFAWGRNEYGQLGNTTLTSLSWTSVAGGDSYSMAIRSDGKLFSWGRNDKGQLGLGHTVNKSAPTQIAVSTNYNLHSTQFTADSGTYLNLPYNAAFGAGTSDFTLEVWIYTTAIGVDRMIIDGGNGAGGRATTSHSLYLTSTGTITYLPGGTAVINAGLVFANTWSHLAVVRISGSTKLYINGIQAGNTYTDAINYGIQQPYIGRNSDGSFNPWTGYISNLRFVKGTGLYTTPFTPPTSILTNITNTVYLVCQNNTFIDNGTANTGNTPFTLTPTGPGITTTTLTPFQTTVYNYSWTQVSATLSHVLAIRTDGTLWAWGANNSGQLGQGDTTTRSAPIQIGTNTDNSWTSVNAGNDASFAIKNDSKLFSWGDNTNGLLGQGDTITRSSPIQIGTSSWTSVSATQHAVGITTANTIFTWGLNSLGQLGDNTIVNKSSPTIVQLGFPSSLLVYNSATVVDNSGNAVSMTATGSPTVGSTVIPFSSTNSVNFPSNTYYTTGSLPAIGTQFTFEFWVYVTTVPPGNWYWLSTSTSVPMFYFVGNSTSVTEIRKINNGGSGNFGASVSLAANTWAHVAYTRNSANLMTIWLNGSSIATSSDSTAYTGGAALIGYPAGGNGGSAAGYMSNFRFINNACLYTNTFTPSTTTLTATGLISSLTYTYTRASAGTSHSVAIRNDSSLYTWGSGVDGRLGNGLTTNRSFAVQIGASSWTQINAGSSWTLGVLSTGGLYSWGAGANGELGSGAVTSRSSPVQVGLLTTWGVLSGKTHALSVTTAGALFTWGTNTTSQLGNNSTTQQNSPVSIAALTGQLFDNVSSPVQIGALSWTQIQAGTVWSAGIVSTGGLYTWGYGVNGELGANTSVQRSSPVQVGALTTWGQIKGTTIVLATTATGALFTWGSGTGGQLGDNTTISRSSPVGVAALTAYPNTFIDNVSSPTQIGAGAGVSSWTQVAAGDLYTMALRAVDGGLFTWGYGILGRLGSGATANRSSPVQVGTSSWLAISTGSTQNPVGLTIVYTLFSWGLNNFGQVGDATTVDKSAPAAVGSVLNQMTDVIKTVSQLGTSTWSVISAGNSHAYAIRSDSGLFAWGQNNNGQLGLTIATTIHRSSPVQVGATSFSQISAGYSIGAAITTLGNLQTTGLGLSGQQGSGATTTRSAFTAVGASSWTNVTALSEMMIGTTLSNLTFVWGGNSNGQLGLTDTTNRSSPVLLGSNLAASMYQTVYPSPVIVSTATTASWTQIGLGDVFGVGIENSGRLYSWGRNNTGQLGDGSTIDNTPTKSSPVQIATTASSFTFINTSSPVQINAGTSWNAVAAGGTHAVAVKSDGTLWAWGVNTYGQTGGLSTLNQYTPKQIDTQNSYTSVTAGTDFSAAITREYSLWRWGYNTTTDIASPHRSNPLQLGSLQYSKVSAAKETALAITPGGILYGWGKITTDDNFSFNLSADPITWGVGYSYSDVNAGDSFIHAVQIDNSLWAYGKNDVGQLGVNDVATRSSPVQIGSGFNWSLLGGGQGPALQAGSLYITGNNANGQLGLSDSANRSSPTQVSANNQSMLPYPVRLNNTKWNYISAGYSHSLAIGSDYVLYAWGSGSLGQLGDNTATVRSSPVVVTLPAGTSSWLAVSAGKDFTVGIRIDNTLWAWGINTRGQLGLSDTTQRNSPVQVGTGYWNDAKAGESHAVGLADNNTLFIWGDDNFGQ